MENNNNNVNDFKIKCNDYINLVNSEDTEKIRGEKCSNLFDYMVDNLCIFQLEYFDEFRVKVHKKLILFKEINPYFDSDKYMDLLFSKENIFFENTFLDNCDKYMDMFKKKDISTDEMVDAYNNMCNYIIENKYIFDLPKFKLLKCRIKGLLTTLCFLQTTTISQRNLLAKLFPNDHFEQIQNVVSLTEPITNEQFNDKWTDESIVKQPNIIFNCYKTHIFKSIQHDKPTVYETLITLFDTPLLVHDKSIEEIKNDVSISDGNFLIKYNDMTYELYEKITTNSVQVGYIYNGTIKNININKIGEYGLISL